MTRKSSENKLQFCCLVSGSSSLVKTYDKIFEGLLVLWLRKAFLREAIPVSLSVGDKTDFVSWNKGGFQNAALKASASVPS